MKDINLFKIYLTKPEKQKSLERKVKVASFLFLGVYCLAAAGIFSYWLLLKRKNDSIQDKIQVQERKIDGLKQTESLQIFLKQRLSALSAYFEQETLDYKEVLDQLELLIPEGVEIRSFGLNLAGKLSITGEAADAVIFADFLERLIAVGENEFSQKVILASASLKEDGFYSFNLEIDVKKTI